MVNRRMKILIYFSVVLLLLSCRKTNTDVEPCQVQLGRYQRGVHLANVDFINEDQRLNWFEISKNMIDGFSYAPAARCIPTANLKSIEVQIAEQEEARKNLR